jgi:hypothetical protein
VRAIEKLLVKYNAHNWVSILSYNKEWLAETVQQYPGTLVMIDKDEMSTADIDYAVTNAFYGIAAKNVEMQKEIVDNAQNKGLKVQIYGAYSQKDILNAVKKLPDFLLTEDIELAQGIVTGD